MYRSIKGFESVYLPTKKENLGKHLFPTYTYYIMIVARASWDYEKANMFC